MSIQNLAVEEEEEEEEVVAVVVVVVVEKSESVHIYRERITLYRMQEAEEDIGDSPPASGLVKSLGKPNPCHWKSYLNQ